MNTPCEGVGPSRMYSWCHPGGDTLAFGGAVTVQVLPEHEKAGKMVRPPMVLPCVLDVAATSETLIPDVAPWNSCTLIWNCPPYVQSLFGMVTTGWVRPWFRYGGMYTSIRSSSGSPGVSGSEPDTSTRPSGRSVASEWYIRVMVVVLRIEIRAPAGFVGS